MDAEYDVEGGYLPSFIEHLKETGKRLGLGEGDVEQSNEFASHEMQTLSPWTPTEYDAFFRALSVYSRWRPDLIAACIPTKGEWEVWMYLEALEEGAEALAMEEDADGIDVDADVESNGGSRAGDVEMASSGSRSQASSTSGSESDSAKGDDEDRYTCEPAHEVSQEWVDAEEVMASWVIHQESQALAMISVNDMDQDEGAIQAEGDDENIGEPPKRKRGRPRISEKGRSRGRSRAKTTLKEDSRSPSPIAGPSTPPPIPDEPPSSTIHQQLHEPSTLPARKRRRIERKRDALMGRLDASQLLVLESILRDGDETMKDGCRSREGSVTAMDGRAVQQEANNTHSRPEDLSNSMIDPALLALSGVPSTGTHPDPDVGPVAGPSRLADSVFQTSSLTVPQTTVAPPFIFPPSTIISNPEPPKNVEPDPSLLSPRGRRRFQKRLYMRRKRALLRDNSAVSEGVLDTRIEKLKPGRKAKSERGETPAVSASAPCSEVPSDEETDVEKNEATHSKGGLTLPYKLKAQFAGFGIDSAYLHDQGMDLLNLGALGRLMGLFTSLEQRKKSEEGVDESTGAESIDARLIQHLQAALVSFVTDILHRAVVWKEGEKKLKDRSRAWRYGDQITMSSIEHAVRSVGSRYHSHKQYFKSALAFYGLSNETGSTDQSTPENMFTDTNAGTPDGVAEAPHVLSFHREMYTPHVRPPSVLRIGALKYLSPTYEQEATRTRRGSSADLEDDLLANETDEDALEAELEEDEEMDSLDLEVSSEYEQRLWSAVRMND